MSWSIVWSLAIGCGKNCANSRVMITDKGSRDKYSKKKRRKHWWLKHHLGCALRGAVLSTFKMISIESERWDVCEMKRQQPKGGNGLVLLLAILSRLPNQRGSLWNEDTSLTWREKRSNKHSPIKLPPLIDWFTPWLIDWVWCAKTAKKRKKPKLEDRRIVWLWAHSSFKHNKARHPWLCVRSSLCINSSVNDLSRAAWQKNIYINPAKTHPDKKCSLPNWALKIDRASHRACVFSLFHCPRLPKSAPRASPDFTRSLVGQSKAESMRNEESVCLLDPNAL